MQTSASARLAEALEISVRAEVRSRSCCRLKWGLLKREILQRPSRGVKNASSNRALKSPAKSEKDAPLPEYKIGIYFLAFILEASSN